MSEAFGLQQAFSSRRVALPVIRDDKVNDNSIAAALTVCVKAEAAKPARAEGRGEIESNFYESPSQGVRVSHDAVST